MSYTHHDIHGDPIPMPVGKVVCVGRNYAAHAQELNNPLPTQPLLFMKPATSLVPFGPSLRTPQGAHFEIEIACLIAAPLSSAVEDEVWPAISHLGLALDLTLRDLQSELKEKGHPWERAKAFDGSCPMSPFIPRQNLRTSQLRFGLDIDDESRQRGDSDDMLTPIAPLIAEMSQSFSLLPGDIVLTGTPAGVGPLLSGQRLRAFLEDVEFHSCVS
ncbi:MAG: 2-keto-4-pentenoate hydratase/2-oxohepta-3-ene-1,7-dioic acid hydratase in catechol pathway [Rhodothermales bacterium]|jgi:2-keto-4-pentenoate hydratase/2-oxohepta-3-ene-1,7-dioic acid hydratase in catechol pathway